MLKEFGLVIIGSGAGGGLRHAISVWFQQNSGSVLPLGTLIVNIVGSFLIGLLAVWLLGTEQQAWRWLLISGFLGGFTTYSAFSLQLLQLLQQGDTARALIYIVMTLVIGLLAVWAGYALGRQLFN